MGIMTALFNRGGQRRIEAELTQMKVRYDEMKVQYENIQRKFDITDWNSFTPIQQEILSSQMLTSSSYFAKVWVYNVCVAKISGEVAKMSQHNYLENAKGESVEGNKIFMKIQGNCNPLFNGFEQIESLAAFYIMNGNFYERVIGTPRMPIELWSLLANNVEPVAGDPAKDEPLVKFYRDSTKAKADEIPPEEVIHGKAFNPENYIKGMPRLQAAAQKLTTLAKAENFNESILTNGIFPSINWHTDQVLSEQQIDEISRRLEKQSAGPSQAGKWISTWGGVKAEKMAFSPEEMNLLESERYNASVIAVSLGVPPETLGMLTDKRTYNNVMEARRDLLESTCMPILHKINSKRSAYFWPNGEFTIKINTKMIEEMQRNATELGASWWITPDQKLELQGHTPTGLPEMQERYIPMGYVNIKDLGMQQDKENF